MTEANLTFNCAILSRTNEQTLLNQRTKSLISEKNGCGYSHNRKESRKSGCPVLIKDIKLNKFVKNDNVCKTYANIIDKPSVKTLSTDRSVAMVMCGFSNTALN